MRCQRPGCTGTIEDGYCDTCGLAPVSGRAPASTPQPPGPGLSGTAQPPRPGPAGTPPPPTPGPPASSIPSQPSGEMAGTTQSRARRGTSRSRISTRGQLGAGLVEIPPIPTRDPASAVLADPAIAEDKRFCANCGDPVGRSRAGNPGRPEGFCRRCGHAFSFVPRLVKGDLVAGQYEVLGCLAHGGLGWIYLARDRNVSNRWVVLKGLLDSGDEDSMAAALAERRFLAQVEHPSIVKIFNFVQHRGSGYIVMEYVGGSSLKDVLKERRAAAGHIDPLPPDQAIAYVLGILPALGYLHRLDLLYCDFKPDNMIQSGDSLKLIDLGGVRRIDDATSAVYGTVGYQAPEIADVGPSISSDLYTVARTLAVLSIDFKGYQREFVASLPRPDDVPLFREFDSLYRFLVKGTATDPDNRFQSADEMAYQLYGVLREVVAARTGVPRPSVSELFSTDLRAKPDEADWRTLPALVVSADDPAAGYLATLGAAGAADQVEQLRAAPVDSVELELRLARCLVEVGDYGGAEKILTKLEVEDPSDWRVAWTRGLSALARHDTAGAWASFDRVYGNVPGEQAPKLALGMTAEIGQAPDRAVPWYDTVARTDPSFITACFGLARCRRATGDRLGALEAFNRVASSSSSYLEAQLSAARTLIEVDGSSAPDVAELAQADSALARLHLSGEERATASRELFEAALQLLRTGKIRPDPKTMLGGEPLTEVRLRLGLEKAYRTLARLASTPQERIQLIDRANRSRPRTLW